MTECNIPNLPINGNNSTVSSTVPFNNSQGTINQAALLGTNQSISLNNSEYIRTYGGTYSQETINQAVLLGTNQFIPSSTIQLYQLDELQTQFEQNTFVNSTNLTVITKYVDLYGQETFDQGLIEFNNFLLSANTNENLNLPVNYPMVQERINKGVAITPIEYAVFMDDIGYNPIITPLVQTTKPKDFLQLYDKSLEGSFSKSSMGSFCELAPSIFGAIGGFFDKIQSFANKITDIINKIKNFSLASLLDTLKSKVLDVVNKAIEKVKNVVQNFSIQGLISQANQFFHSKVIDKFQSVKENAMKFFNEFNIDNFKKKIEGLLSYASNIFKDPKIEEIQFLIYRFCSFISNVESIIDSVKKPLEDFSNRYASVAKILSSNSKSNTIAAISAGAKRFSEEEITQTVQRGISAETARGNQPAPTADEYSDLPQWNNGKGDSRVKFQGNWVKPPQPGCGGGMGEEGWTGTNIDARAYLMRLYKAFSEKTGVNQIIINSAYRSPKYNQCLRDKGVGAAPRSKHTEGIAFDVTWSGYPKNRDTFIQLARTYGFNGIGIYGSFTHIDRGPARDWRG